MPTHWLIIILICGITLTGWYGTIIAVAREQDAYIACAPFVIIGALLTVGSALELIG